MDITAAGRQPARPARGCRDEGARLGGRAAARRLRPVAVGRHGARRRSPPKSRACLDPDTRALGPAAVGRWQAAQPTRADRGARLAARAQRRPATAFRRRPRRAHRPGAARAADGAGVGAGGRGRARQPAPAPGPARPRAGQALCTSARCPRSRTARSSSSPARSTTASSSATGQAHAPPAARCARARCPERLLDGAFRRLARPRGPLGRAARARRPRPGALLVEKAAGDLISATPPVAPPRGAGMIRPGRRAAEAGRDPDHARRQPASRR